MSQTSTAADQRDYTPTPINETVPVLNGSIRFTRRDVVAFERFAAEMQRAGIWWLIRRAASAVSEMYFVVLPNEKKPSLTFHTSVRYGYILLDRDNRVVRRGSSLRDLLPLN